MIKPFRSKTFEDLVRQMNEFEKEQKGIYASNIFPPSPFSENWYSCMFYNPQIKEDAKSSNTPSSGATTPKPFLTNSPELKLATQKQVDLLKKLGYNKDTTKLSKQEAFQLLNEYFGK